MLVVVYSMPHHHNRYSARNLVNVDRIVGDLALMCTWLAVHRYDQPIHAYNHNTPSKCELRMFLTVYVISFDDDVCTFCFTLLRLLCSRALNSQYNTPQAEADNRLYTFFPNCLRSPEAMKRFSLCIVWLTRHMTISFHFHFVLFIVFVELDCDYAEYERCRSHTIFVFCHRTFLFTPLLYI